MRKSRLLIIDSDSKWVQALREHLLAQGFEVNALAEFSDTRFLREPSAPHLIILNSGIDALELVKRIRRESQVPLILTTNATDISQRVEALESGADDHLSKPIEPRELAARIQSILRRAPVRDHMLLDLETREWRFQGLILQSNRRRILLDNQPVELTTAEFDLLRLLVSNAGQVLSRELILDQLRGIEWETVDRSVDILVSRLRDKLKDDPRRPRYVRTVRSIGYQFIGELEQEAQANS
ncbi:MAG: response regulator transcription factor [Bdellovibrionota bacterium]